MTVERNSSVQKFVEALQAAFAAAEPFDPKAASFAAELFERLAQPAPSSDPMPVALPVCSHLPKAIAVAGGTARVAALAGAFHGIVEKLCWKRRSSGGPHASDNWWDGHANAVIIGQGGLEERADVTIGASLLAPHVRYPDHTHPPEELYMVLTPSRFQHGSEAWQPLMPGNSFHNPPGILHAMASGDDPLLAIWTMIIR